MRFKARYSTNFFFAIIAAGFIAILLLVTVPEKSIGSSGGGGDMFGNNQAEVDKFEIVGDLPVENGVRVTKDREIVIEVTFKGAASHYQICENADFTGCGWQKLPFNGRIRFLLSEGSGIKKIYFRARYLRQQSTVITAEVNYQP